MAIKDHLEEKVEALLDTLHDKAQIQELQNQVVRLEEELTQLRGPTHLLPLIKKYESLLDSCGEISSEEMDLELRKITDVLGSSQTEEGQVQLVDNFGPGHQIDDFLQSTIPFLSHKFYFQFTGRFINRLIQNSYENGKDKPFITLTTFPHFEKISALCSHLNGNPSDSNNKLVYIIVRGGVGDYFGYKSRYINAIIEGNAGDNLGYEARDSFFTVYGKCGQGRGENSYNCRFSIEKRKK